LGSRIFSPQNLQNFLQGGSKIFFSISSRENLGKIFVDFFVNFFDNFFVNFFDNFFVNFFDDFFVNFFCFCFVNPETQ